MSLYEAAESALLKITDAMTESRTFPVNLMGPLVYEVGDWTIDKLDAAASVSPVLFVTRRELRSRVQNAFEVGRDIERAEGKPPPRLAPVRHLRSL